MKMNKFYIYGAGIVATSIYTAIKTLYHRSPVAFLVSDLAGNPSQIDGIPVKGLHESLREEGEESAQYLIAVPEVHHEVVASALLQQGVSREGLIFVDSVLENKLMGIYYRGLPEFEAVSECEGVPEAREVSKPEYKPEHRGAEPVAQSGSVIAKHITVFQATCHVDKPLAKPVPIPQYVRPIQVGAALTDMRIAELADDVGDNISLKNRNYCELTATYYAWKNCQAKYKGLCHYRRIFDIQDGQMQQLLAKRGGVDVILPYPTIHYPNIAGQHERYVCDADWDAMLQALEEMAPEYYEAYVTAISKEQYFYNFNMLIAKREIFDDYCSFLFRVLERTEELVTPKGWERADRFAGYLGENLTTLYFRKNRDALSIVHAGKVLLT